MERVVELPPCLHYLGYTVHLQVTYSCASQLARRLRLARCQQTCAAIPDTESLQL